MCILQITGCIIPFKFTINNKEKNVQIHLKFRNEFQDPIVQWRSSLHENFHGYWVQVPLEKVTSQFDLGFISENFIRK